jgi:monoterpene epsilon-lactone hydrolase
MGIKEKRNLNLMKAIKAVHSVVESDDIEKQRQSQDYIGTLFSANKEVNYESVIIDGIEAEWVSANRKRLKKHVILYCHGGGYITGSMKYARTLTAKLAVTTSIDVLCFDYGLAPEYKAPRALEDALKAWDYLMYQGYGSQDVVIAGDSAGGNLALALTLKLKEQKRMLPRGLVLMSPWTDLTRSGKSHTTKAEVDPVLDKEYLDFAIASYTEGKNLKSPLISPLFGDFEGLPPVYIQVGDNEILLNDSTMLYKKIIHAGAYARIDIFKGMWHVFQMSPFKKAYDAMEKNADFIFEIFK